MEKIVFENGVEFELLPTAFPFTMVGGNAWKTFTVAGEPDTIKENFTTGAVYYRAWGSNAGDDVVAMHEDLSAWCVAGDIVDHRNGTYTVAMRKKTAQEIAEERAEIGDILADDENITEARAGELRLAIESLADTLSDSDALEVVELFPAWSGDAQYETGDRVRYGGVLYVALMSFMSQEDWTPVDASSLWAKVLIPDPDVIPEWEQPDSTNPYQMGDRVTHNGKTWESDCDSNVWEPGVFGWHEVTE